MMPKRKMIHRWSAPSKYDQLPCGTIICTSIKYKNSELIPWLEVYVQISKYDSSPLWEHIGRFPSDGCKSSDTLKWGVSNLDFGDLIFKEARRVLNIKKDR